MYSQSSYRNKWLPLPKLPCTNITCLLLLDHPIQSMGTPHIITSCPHPTSLSALESGLSGRGPRAFLTPVGKQNKVLDKLLGPCVLSRQTSTTSELLPNQWACRDGGPEAWKAQLHNSSWPLPDWLLLHSQQLHKLSALMCVYTCLCVCVCVVTSVNCITSNKIILALVHIPTPVCFDPFFLIFSWHKA